MTQLWCFSCLFTQASFSCCHPSLFLSPLPLPAYHHVAALLLSLLHEKNGMGSRKEEKEGKGKITHSKTHGGKRVKVVQGSSLAHGKVSLVGLVF